MDGAGFHLIPAVDVRAGRCVRLRQGDFAQETIYARDPAEVARRWEAEGARRLHVVDLDGARSGVRSNAAVIERLIRAVAIPVQVGGGIRSLEVAREVLDAGAERVIVGTAAVERPEELGAWLEALGEGRIVVGVDAREGRVATRGWLETTAVSVDELCGALADAGVRRILFTDIARDGTLAGPNARALRAITAGGRLRVLASGGIATTDDLRVVAAAGAEGAIVGTALYDGRLRLADALAAVQALSPSGAC